LRCILGLLTFLDPHRQVLCESRRIQVGCKTIQGHCRTVIYSRLQAISMVLVLIIDSISQGQTPLCGPRSTTNTCTSNTTSTITVSHGKSPLSIKLY
jgi:hypothetical protein